MSGLNILVVGASIAGPTAAYWLAKAGANVTVIERFPELRTNGQGIDIRQIGVSVMRKMPGMEAAVRAKTTEMTGMSFVREDGRPYGVILPSGDPDQQTLVSEFEIFRGDLSKIIYDMTKDNEHIKYVFGEEIASMRQNGDEDSPIIVEFKNGLKTTDFDLVVACDGATSRTRAMGFQCGVRDHIKPTNWWAAYFTLPDDLLKGSRIAIGHSAPGGRSICLLPDPAGATRGLLMNITPTADDSALRQFREAAEQGDDALKEFIAKHYKDAGWRTDEIMQSMMESDDFYAHETVQVKTPSLYKGRFVLAGDAGYATGPTGGGTSLAMGGAYLLAGELCKHKGDIQAGLAGYETQIRPFITELQKIPPFIGTFMAPQTAWGIWLRNHIFAFISWTGIITFLQKYVATAFGSSETFKLPEYDWVR